MSLQLQQPSTLPQRLLYPRKLLADMDDALSRTPAMKLNLGSGLG